MLVAAWLATAPGVQAASGQRQGPSILPVPKAGTGSISYTDFTGGSCSEASFLVLATARVDIVGAYEMRVRTTLDGVSFDTDNIVDAGPDQYPVKFERLFTPPPPATSTYTFEFLGDVIQNGELLGRTRTTIVCQATVLQATSRWLPATAAVPVGTPAGLALLAAALALAAFARSRKPLA